MKIISAAVLGVAGVFVGAWLWMLLIGVIHHEWLPMMPTVGYTGALAIVATASASTAAGTFLLQIWKAIVGDD